MTKNLFKILLISSLLFGNICDGGSFEFQSSNGVYTVEIDVDARDGKQEETDIGTIEKIVSVKSGRILVTLHPMILGAFTFDGTWEIKTIRKIGDPNSLAIIKIEQIGGDFVKPAYFDLVVLGSSDAIFWERHLILDCVIEDPKIKEVILNSIKVTYTPNTPD